MKKSFIALFLQFDQAAFNNARHADKVTGLVTLLRDKGYTLVPLGEVDVVHRAQQSIRTFFNQSRPERHYVKTALAIQNMGFLRGLSPAYMAAKGGVHALTRAMATELAADGPDGAGRHYPLRRAACPHQGVNAGTRHGGHQRTGNVAGGVDPRGFRMGMKTADLGIEELQKCGAYFMTPEQETSLSRILVSDQVKDVVQEYDLEGNYLGVFAPAGGVDNAILDNIRGIALAPNG